MGHLKKPLNLIHLKSFLALGFIFLITLFNFQNCAEPLSESEQISSVASTAPWAFEAKMDTLAHMSCGSMPAGYDNEAFFSYKLGAHQSGSGLRYTDSFIRHTGAYSPSKRRLTLLESAENKGARLQIAIRSLTNLNQVFATQGTLQNGLAYGSFAEDLTSENVALQLPQQLGTQMTRHFPAVGDLEMQNDLLQGDASVRGRQELNSAAGVLAYTFANERAPDGAVGPQLNRAYGRGLLLSFTRPGHISSGEANLISRVTEYDLLTGSQISTSWSCPTQFRFLIVRPIDLGTRIVCNAQPTQSTDPVPQNAQQAAALQALRKVASRDHWAVDLQNSCIVPKSNINGLCYGNNSSGFAIRYPSSGATSCDGRLNTCPHYLSICQKQ